MLTGSTAVCAMHVGRGAVRIDCHISPICVAYSGGPKRREYTRKDPVLLPET